MDSVTSPEYRVPWPLKQARGPLFISTDPDPRFTIPFHGPNFTFTDPGL